MNFFFQFSFIIISAGTSCVSSTYIDVNRPILLEDGYNEEHSYFGFSLSGKIESEGTK